MRVGKFAVAFGLALGPRGQDRPRGRLAGEVGGFVARLTRAGRRDRSFGGGDGLVRSNFRQGFANITDVAVQRNGKIVLAGFGGDIPGVPGGMLAVRLTPKGKARSRLRQPRGAAVPARERRDFALVGVAIQPSGRIVVGGAFSVFGTDGFLAARLFGDPVRK